MKRSAEISAEAVQVILELTNGFSAQEVKASRRSQGTDAYVHLAKFTWTTTFQATTSALREQQNSLFYFRAVGVLFNYDLFLFSFPNSMQIAELSCF